MEKSNNFTDKNNEIKLRKPEDIIIEGRTLREILDLHREWLKNFSKGERANLTGANLQEAVLERAELRGANLTGANLTGANLSNSNLQDSNLQEANLTNANLTDTLLENK